MFFTIFRSWSLVEAVVDHLLRDQKKTGLHQQPEQSAEKIIETHTFKHCQLTSLSSSSVPKYLSMMSKAFWYISIFSWLCKVLMLIINLCCWTLNDVYLKKFYFIKTKNFLDDNCIRIASSTVLWFLFSESQDVLQSIESHLDYLTVHHSQQVTERRNAALLNQEPGKILVTTL